MNNFTDVLKKEYEISVPLKKFLFVLFFSYLTFCGAMIKIYVPFTPVPFTLQNFILFISIYYLSSKEVSISQLLYIFIGFIGAPVFAAGFTGASIFLGPTAGYLIGFVISGTFMAFIYSKIKSKNCLKIFLLFLSGAVLILLSGVLHLAFVYGFGFKRAFLAGFLPFIVTDTFKALGAALIFKFKK